MGEAVCRRRRRRSSYTLRVVSVIGPGCSPSKTSCRCSSTLLMSSIASADERCGDCDTMSATAVSCFVVLLVGYSAKTLQTLALKNLNIVHLPPTRSIRLAKQSQNIVETAIYY